MILGLEVGLLNIIEELVQNSVNDNLDIERLVGGAHRDICTLVLRKIRINLLPDIRLQLIRLIRKGISVTGYDTHAHLRVGLDSTRFQKNEMRENGYDCFAIRSHFWVVEVVNRKGKFAYRNKNPLLDSDLLKS